MEQQSTPMANVAIEKGNNLNRLVFDDLCQQLQLVAVPALVPTATEKEVTDGFDFYFIDFADQAVGPFSFGMMVGGTMMNLNLKQTLDQVKHARQ